MGSGFRVHGAQGFSLKHVKEQGDKDDSDDGQFWILRRFFPKPWVQYCPPSLTVG